MKGCVFVWLLAACVAPAAGGAVERREVATSRVLVRITFEPPLAEPGWLVVEHESGVRERVATSRSGVELSQWRNSQGAIFGSALQCRLASGSRLKAYLAIRVGSRGKV